MEKMKRIKVDNCWDCPFSNYSEEYGYNSCSLVDLNLNIHIFEKLPKDNVHKNCPLKKNTYKIELKNG